jgi:hypothetical protein
MLAYQQIIMGGNREGAKPTKKTRAPISTPADTPSPSPTHFKIKFPQPTRTLPPPMTGPKLEPSNMKCDKEYLDSWYTLTDEQYCENLSRLIKDQLMGNSLGVPPEFPVPNIGASTSLSALLEEQARIHSLVASGAEPPNQKYLVWSLSGGIGNRVQSLVSTFMAALLSGRVLLMKDWCMVPSKRVSTAKRVNDLQLEELDILFNDSWHSNEELFCPALPMMTLRSFKKKYPHYFSKPEYKMEHVKVDISARHDQSNKRWQRLLCNNLTDSFSQKFVYIWTNQYFLPLLFANPIHSAQMRAMFPGNDPFGPLVRFLLLPHRVVMKRTHEFICKNFHGRKVVGLQVRAFRAGGMEQMATTFANCAKQIHSDVDVYFVASMHTPVRETLTKIFGLSKIVVLDQPRGHQHTGDLELDREALSDMLILMHTGDFLLSPGSTFGLVAAGYRSYLPVRVHRSQADGLCSRMRSSQPCFGSWLSYDFISQKSQQGVYTCKAQSIPSELENCVKA